MPTNIELQTKLINMGLLDPPADGSFGPQSIAARKYAYELTNTSDSDSLIKAADPIPLKLSNDFASRIIKYMQAKDYFIAKGESMYNIVYVEGCDDDGTPNDNAFNSFGDLRSVIEIGLDGVPKFVGMWNATTNSGAYWTYNRMNPAGAANIKFGQYKAWSVGIHGNSRPHEALVQVADITVCRDDNEDGSRRGDQEDTGLFGVDEHSAFDAPYEAVERWSAGCLVGRTQAGHEKFMEIVKSDRRYDVSSNYVFMTCILPGDDLAAKFPI